MLKHFPKFKPWLRINVNYLTTSVKSTSNYLILTYLMSAPLQAHVVFCHKYGIIKKIGRHFFHTIFSVHVILHEVHLLIYTIISITPSIYT